jgi:L-lactate dehydrogenase (cytochrome)/(S)-mandelate dehydrogenase
MSIDNAINIEDLRRRARRRLPKIAFDFIEGGCEDETCLIRNEQSFIRYRLVPRYLLDMTGRDQSATLFGRTYASPFGIAPTGLAGLFRPGADLMLAEAARLADIPFIQSGASTASIEALAKVAPEHTWYQLYQPRDQNIADDLVRRAADAGMRTLVLTVDAQGGANHERNLRNGFTQPLAMTPSIILEALAHPAWLFDYLRHGMPVFADWKRYAGDDADARAVATFVKAQGRMAQTWNDVDHFRRLWPGAFVLKGVLHPDDAARAAEAGVDGIIVSNHGGRRLDRAASPIDVLPMIRAAAGEKMTLMLDGGIRRGSDIVTALCLGARFCFVGRATLYGVAAGGLAGARRAVEILRNEIDLVMAQIGCATVPRLGAGYLLADADSATNGLRSVPIPVISTSTTSPAFKLGEVPSVPIQMTSPG